MFNIMCIATQTERDVQCRVDHQMTLSTSQGRDVARACVAAFGLDLTNVVCVAGNKVEQWFRTPFDIAAFGPRATLGALLSMPERLQTL